MSTASQAPASRTVYFELLRILAIFMVLFNHTGTAGFLLFTITENPVLYWPALFLSVSCKIAVPLFFMISGALLLGKEESICLLYQKRVARILLVLAAADGFYYVYFGLENGRALSFSGYLRSLAEGGSTKSMWFLYSYLAFLVMLPLLRRLARAMQPQEYLYLICAHVLLVSVVPLAAYFCKLPGITGFFSVPLLTASNIFFALTGYYFARVMNEKYLRPRNLCLGAAGAFVLILLACLATRSYGLATGAEAGESFPQNFHNVPAPLAAMVVFCFAKWLLHRFPAPAIVAKLICFFGQAAFGIYLLDPLLRRATHFIYQLFVSYIGIFPACMLWLGSCILLGGLVVNLLKKLPGVSKLL